MDIKAACAALESIPRYTLSDEQEEARSFAVEALGDQQRAVAHYQGELDALANEARDDFRVPWLADRVERILKEAPKVVGVDAEGGR